MVLFDSHKSQSCGFDYLYQLTVVQGCFQFGYRRSLEYFSLCKHIWFTPVTHVADLSEEERKRDKERGEEPGDE